MPTINPQFRIKESNAKGESQVYLRAYFDNKRFTYYPGYSIKSEHWLEEEGRPITTQSESTVGKLSKKDLERNRIVIIGMKQYAAKLHEIYNHFLFTGTIPTTKLLKEELDKKMKKKELEDRIEFLTEYAERFISRTNKKPYTIRNYRTTLNHLIAFEKKRHRRIRINEVDLDLYDALVKFFLKNGKSTNTIGTHIKNLKVFLTDAEERGYLVHSDYKSKRFKVVEENNPSMYLTIEEIALIGKLDLTNSPTLDQVRDLFLVGCYTGIRYSDYNQVNEDHLIRNAKGVFLKIIMEKTGGQVVVPLRPEVLMILEKYRNRLPRALSNQKMNVHLKTIAAKAELNETIPVSITRGGMNVEKVQPKHKLVTTHTARRSFATNAYLAGVPAISLMKITGHRTEKSFLRYINMSEEDNAYHMAQHEFFVGKMKVVG